MATKKATYNWIVKSMAANTTRVSKYWMVNAEPSLCPHCRKSVTLLGTNNLRGPAFYICWTCKLVAQVGVGPVLPSES